MDKSDKSPSMTAIVVVSLGLHGLVALGMEGGAHAAAPVRRETVRVTMREVARPTPEAPAVEAPDHAVAHPEPMAQPRVARSKARRDARRPAAPTPSATPAQEARPSAEAPPVLDFTGVTLTSPSGGFAQAAGSGARMTDPLGNIQSGARAGGTGKEGGGKAATEGGALVALKSLSRPPRAPPLDAALAANYPKNAHDLGLSGEAVVLAHILPTGQVAATHVLIASAPEFGKACQRTLSGSRWSAPLDVEGRAVATELSYKCVFEVTH
ncbi:MAG: energy transducer TonB [Polyangiales bacterium]